MKKKVLLAIFSGVALVLIVGVMIRAKDEDGSLPIDSVGEAGALSTATISGTIRRKDDSQPVSGVQVYVDGDPVTTGADGVYSKGGLVVGARVVVDVHPPQDQHLSYRRWATATLAGDCTKDFSLESGYRLQGQVRQPNGELYQTEVELNLKTLDVSLPEGEWLGVNVVSGTFDTVVPPGSYLLSPMIEFLLHPYFIPWTVVDLSGSDVEGLTVELINGPPFPVTPPVASLITVGDPDKEGYATIQGAPGTVDPLADIIVVNLNTHTAVTLTTDHQGAFTTRFYAPPGSSLLFKRDAPESIRINRLMHEANGPEKITVCDYMNPLPGTILPVGVPEPGDGSSQAFHAVGSLSGDELVRWGGWWLSGTLQTPSGGDGFGLIVQPGQPVTLTARLLATSPAITCTGTPTYPVQTSIWLQYLFGPDGRSEPSDIWFNTYLFTPTGLPIEHEGAGEIRRIVTGTLFTSLGCVAPRAFEGFLTVTFTVPADLPDGIYLPELDVAGEVPLSTDIPLVPVWFDAPNADGLPPLHVGSPSAPRIPWTLLYDYPVNGHRGVQAREDSGVFATPTRVLFAPHQVVIPRLDERTGEPLAYRLEPGSYWIGGTDRRLPNPPHIPLDPSSGEMTVEVHKPDGNMDQLGPAPIAQSYMRTPVIPGGEQLHESTGHVGDPYHLTTMNDAFDYTFDQYGPHTIVVRGYVNDVYGNIYSLDSTYEVVVARVLDLDPAQLPSTPYVQGDAFAPGLHLFPPVPADVTVQLVQMPYSDPGLAITATVSGQANRFGTFQPPVDTVITMTVPGEFRVDISAVYTDADGTLWAGYMTWGNVIEGPGALIEAHGRRGMDFQGDVITNTLAWFEALDLPPEKVGIEVYYPYFSGDVHWGDEREEMGGDSIHPIVTVKDLTAGGTVTGTIYDVIKSHFPRAYNQFRFPPSPTMDGLKSRLMIGEAPMFITTKSGIDPAVKPEDIDLWGYWYSASERPDVRVHEMLSEDGNGTGYWRFNDTYAYQIGEPADGDQPGDIKWEFGGIVFRTISETNPSSNLHEYAIYSSFWVLLPHDDPVGTRIAPPFQDATGASINGGAILTITVDGVPTGIDMLFLPKGVRPGDVLEVGDVIAFSGHVGPPLDSQVSVTLTSPSKVYTATLRANKIGWIYDHGLDLVADEPGRWTVDVHVLHDRPYVGNGVTPLSHNTGTVMGTTGRYEFYVVEPGSPRLFVTSPQPGFITWPQSEIEPIHIRGIAPAGTTEVRYTIHDKGIVMGQGGVTPDASGVFTVTYDAETLHESFPMLSLTAHEGRWEGLADEVAINLLAVGEEPLGNTVTLIGEEVFIANDEPPDPSHSIYLPLVLKES